MVFIYWICVESAWKQQCTCYNKYITNTSVEMLHVFLHNEYIYTRHNYTYMWIYQLLPLWLDFCNSPLEYILWHHQQRPQSTPASNFVLLLFLITYIKSKSTMTKQLFLFILTKIKLSCIIQYMTPTFCKVEGPGKPGGLKLNGTHQLLA
jgi:hypothetical protein